MGRGRGDDWGVVQNILRSAPCQYRRQPVSAVYEFGTSAATPFPFPTMTTKRAYSPPEALSDRARALWRELVPHKARSAGRLALLRAALEDLDIADQARAQLRAHGYFVTTPGSGAIHAHPMVSVLREAHSRFVAAWATLGFEFDDEEDSAWE